MLEILQLPEVSDLPDRAHWHTLLRVLDADPLHCHELALVPEVATLVHRPVRPITDDRYLLVIMMRIQEGLVF